MTSRVNFQKKMIGYHWQEGSGDLVREEIGRRHAAGASLTTGDFHPRGGDDDRLFRGDAPLRPGRGDRRGFPWALRADLLRGWALRRLAARAISAGRDPAIDGCAGRVALQRDARLHVLPDLPRSL